MQRLDARGGYWEDRGRAGRGVGGGFKPVGLLAAHPKCGARLTEKIGSGARFLGTNYQGHLALDTRAYLTTSPVARKASLASGGVAQTAHTTSMSRFRAWPDDQPDPPSLGPRL